MSDLDLAALRAMLAAYDPHTPFVVNKRTMADLLDLAERAQAAEAAVAEVRALLGEQADEWDGYGPVGDHFAAELRAALAGEES